jgi:hypothetical protein
MKGPDMFLRFRDEGQGGPLREAGLKPDTELLVVERSGERRAFRQTQMTYHHMAQGEIAGEPYLMSY